MIKSFFKGIFWEAIGITILYFLTKNLTIGAIYVLLRIITFPIFEKLWSKVADD